MDKALAPELFKNLNDIQVLDFNFPIREGESQVDGIALNANGEAMFLWVREHCGTDSIARLLADYEWIRKNELLWPHLFPELVAQGPLKLNLGLIAAKFDPEVRFFLPYLQGIRLQLRQYRAGVHGVYLVNWPEESNSPTGMQAPKLKIVSQVSGPLLTREEIDDLIRLQPVNEGPSDETTDSHYGDSEFLP